MLRVNAIRPFQTDQTEKCETEKWQFLFFCLTFFCLVADWRTA
jgi:hypothetical protein